MTRLRQDAIELLEQMPEDKLIFMIQIMKGVRGLLISTPGGRVATYQINRHVPIKLGSFIFKTTLLIMRLDSVDIILGTDWLSRHHAVIDVAARAIEIHSPLDGEITLYLPDQDCTRSCAFVMIESPVEKIPVVCDYPDVFPDELPGMPPDRDIEFAIELQPGTAPISKRPYRMPPAELAELKKQLQELLDKGIVKIRFYIFAGKQFFLLFFFYIISLM